MKQTLAVVVCFIHTAFAFGGEAGDGLKSDVLKETLEEKEQEIRANMDALAEKAAVINEKNGLIQRLNQDVSDLEASESEAWKFLADDRLKCSANEAKLKADYEATFEEKDRMNKDLGSAMEEKDKENARLGGALEEKYNEIDELKISMTELDNMAVMKELMMEEKVIKMEEKDKEIAELKNELKKLDEEKHQILAQFAAVEASRDAELDEVKAQNDEQEKSLKESREAEATLTASLETETMRTEQLTSRINSLEDELEEKDEVITHTEAQREEDIENLKAGCQTACYNFRKGLDNVNELESCVSTMLQTTCATF
jgi:chromosome segregation ATPase